MSKHWSRRDAIRALGLTLGTACPDYFRSLMTNSERGSLFQTRNLDETGNGKENILKAIVFTL